MNWRRHNHSASRTYLYWFVLEFLSWVFILNYYIYIYKIDQYLRRHKHSPSSNTQLKNSNFLKNLHFLLIFYIYFYLFFENSIKHILTVFFLLSQLLQDVTLPPYLPNFMFFLSLFKTRKKKKNNESTLC